MPAPFWNFRGGDKDDAKMAVASPSSRTHSPFASGTASTTAPAPGASATATNLRWRARIAKEAMAFPFDDSSTVAYHDDDESKFLNHHDKNAPLGRSSGSPFRKCGSAAASWIASCRNLTSLRRGMRPVVVPACAATAVASSLYALTVSTHVMVALASALTVATSVVVLIQQRMLHSGGSVQQHHVFQQTQALHDLQVERERLYRQVLQLDETAERRRDVQRQLQAHIARMTTEASEDANPPAENAATTGQRGANVSDDYIAAAIRTSALYKQTQTQLLEQSQHELVVMISKAMVESLMADGDSSAAAATAAEASLLANLRSLPGVACDENLVRQFLKEARARAGPAEGASSSSLASPAVIAYVNLLLQARMDGELAAMSGATASAGPDGHLPGTPQRRKRRVRAQQLQQQQRKQLSAVFVFDPDKRLRGSSSGDETAVSV